MAMQASSSKCPARTTKNCDQANSIIITSYTNPKITTPSHETNYPQRSYQTPNPSPAQDSPNRPTHQSQTRTPPGFFVYPEKIVKEGVSECKRSLLGKLITNKPVHGSSIQMGLESIWGAPPGLKIQEIEGKILQFFMDETMDQERILLGNPWIFRNSWLIIQPWDRNTDPTLLDFEHAPVWIQLWGLPPHCKTKQMGHNIGELLGKVEASELYEYPGKKRIVKIKVAIKVYQPIASGILIGNANDGTNWIDFRYEKLPLVCFKCGIVGHAENLCPNRALDLANSAPLGPWIWSNQYGRRIMETKDRKYHSNPSMAKNFGTYSPPVPVSMLEQMAAMKIQDDIEDAASNTNANTNRSEDNKTQASPKTPHTHQSSHIGTGKSPMETTGTMALISQAKRQRVESNSSNNMEFSMVDTQMAGPAGQASQQQ
ncbi:zinc CCHC-type-like protein [Trifolium medium]|uniref:Zinc CCHC-type-like protein n=1 Tax=Trifolium medium TaxID=97028 RepID=A0A392M3D3_9FABA|nr:zinc CCHC-type-like protein [Trifolium medium]